MSKLRIRLLGGFEAWDGDRQVGGFESQKVRALLAYLACHRHRAFSRDHLAGLLWPERRPEAARHALRQAVYNLRATLGAPGGAGLVASSNLEIGLTPGADLWLDVEAFEEALARGAEREAVDLHHLSAAVQLYRGDLLAGFFVKESPAFEEWMLTQQVRLREAAVEALHRLIEVYRRRGEPRFGVHYAQRLVALEPLSEEAHRHLMRFFAHSGQRNRAMAQYEGLAGLLRHELGVEPLEETRELYESIRAEAFEEEAGAVEAEPMGPLIPLVGRGDVFARLREGWSRVLAGGVHLTLLTGEGGVGKTRVVKSFLDAATSRRRSTVLKGRCYELAPLLAYRPFVETLRGALAEETETAERALARVPAAALADLALLVPELRDLRPDLPPSPSTGPVGEGTAGRGRLFAAVAAFLQGLCRGGPGEGGPDPVIVFLDDLHLGDRDSFELLGSLLATLGGPVWFVACAHGDVLGRDHPLGEVYLDLESAGAATRVEVGRLSPSSLEEIAGSLVGEAQAAELASFLSAWSGGLPLAMAEIVNYLWDEGVLVSAGGGRWALARPLAGVAVAMADLRDLVRVRLRRLPSSARRLAALAAVVGQSFDAQLLQEAGDEHIAVVEVGLELMLRRWLIRQFSYSWSGGGPEAGLARWSEGVRRGSFEFAHRAIRGAIHEDVNPLRRQAMHAQVADAIARLRGDRDSEALAFHRAAAGQWEEALPELERAAERALAVHAEDTAQRYWDQAVEALSRLLAGARNAAQAERWRMERERLLARLREIGGRAVGV